MPQPCRAAAEPPGLSSRQPPGFTAIPLGRRRLLQLAGAAGLSLLAPNGARAQGASTGLSLMIEGITPQTPRDLLFAVLAPFVTREIPVSLLVEPRDASGATLDPQGALAALIARVAREYPARTEIVCRAPGLAGRPPYFQARTAREARAALVRALGPGAEVPIVSLCCEDPGDYPALDPVRSAGFRSVVLLSDEDAPVLSERCGVTIACLRGGHRHALAAADPVAFLAGLRSAAARADLIQVCLSLADAGKIDPAALGARARQIAEGVAAELEADRIFGILPRENVVWFASATERLAALLVEVPPEGDAAGRLAMTEFLAQLASAGIAHGLAGADPAEPSLHCLTAVPVGVAPVSCLALDGAAAVPANPPDILIHTAAMGVPGLDDAATLHLPAPLRIDGTEIPGNAALAADRLRDLTLLVQPRAYATAAARTATLALLQDLRATRNTAYRDVPAFAREVLRDEPALRLLRDTRRDAAARPTPPQTALSDPERALLLRDAESAWSYVAGLTDDRTGLLPSTVFYDPDAPSRYRVLTMWDMASLFHAVICAHEIGLIDTSEFGTRVAALLLALPVQRIDGLLLPASKISSDTGRPMTGDFNACDTGRLLIALHALNSYPASRGAAEALVRRWDLAGVVSQRRVQSITWGRRTDVFLSHCTHYMARGFGLWGIEVDSPYTMPPGQSLADTQMALLYRVAEIGPLGGDGLLLEGVELGFSDPTDWLAEVLGCAQERWHARTGTLYCVSEMPMDVAPWFTYQGLSVNAEDDPWGVVSVDPSAQFRGPDFRRQALVVSTKAAFLWSALRPGAYSDKLLAHVRDRARLAKGGFSTGIYAATGEAMPNYTDINTNGIALQGIAHILRGRVLR